MKQGEGAVGGSPTKKRDITGWRFKQQGSLNHILNSLYLYLRVCVCLCVVCMCDVHELCKFFMACYLQALTMG